VDPTTDLLLLVDLKTGKRTKLTGPVRWPAWSADSRYIYFKRDGINWILRVRVSDGAEEKLVELPFRTASWSFTLGPDDSPIVLREHGRYDLYALALVAP
jgi:hypothetical protein